jgi:hypothetical protein
MTYNGWSNFETWAVFTWLGNEERSYRYWHEATTSAWYDAADDPPFTRSEVARRALADRLRLEVDDANPLADQATLFTDLLGAALGAVDWGEIANAWLNGCDEVEFYLPITATLPG